MAEVRTVCEIGIKNTPSVTQRRQGATEKQHDLGCDCRTFGSG
jgi:hypothetical protein